LIQYLNEQFVGRYAHFVNGADVVPRVPPGFEHGGSLVWFTDGGVKRSKPLARMSRAPAAPSAAGDEMRVERLPALSQPSFQSLQLRLQSRQNPSGPLVNTEPAPAAYSSYVDDHAMTFYLKKIRTVLGLATIE
jgi:hypothetical protein